MAESSDSGRRGVDLKKRAPLKQRAWSEFRRFLVMFLYLWVLFAIFDLYRSVILAEHHVNYRAQGFAAVNALMLAKVMLLAESLNVGGRFRNRVLILSVLYQAFTFTIVFITFHIIERGLVGAFEGKTLAESLPGLGGNALKVIVSAGAVIFVALIPFFAFKDVARAIGEREMRALMFSSGADRATRYAVRGSGGGEPGAVLAPFSSMSSRATALMTMRPWDAGVYRKAMIASHQKASQSAG